MELNYEKYIELKNKGLKRAEIAAYFDMPDWKIKKHIAANAWGKKLPSIGNLHAFDEYTEASCYWAGFLAADGNVDSKGRIRLMLKYDDLSHLEKFKKFLLSTHTISSNITEYNRCSFEFTDRGMCEVLDLNFNIVPNKSLVITFPKIPKQYLRDFIRGYFDGDGSVCESFSNKNSITATLYTSFTSGSKPFIETLFVILNQELGLGGHLQDFNTNTKWQIKYNTNDSITLLNYMYKDSRYYLDRKYSIYKRTVLDQLRLQR